MCPVCLQPEAFEYRLTDSSGIPRFLWHARFQGSGPAPPHERSCPLALLVGPNVLPIDRAKRLEARSIGDQALKAISALRGLGYADELMVEAINDLIDMDGRSPDVQATQLDMRRCENVGWPVRPT